jgi:type IV pilus assembly protein PilV
MRVRCRRAPRQAGVGLVEVLVALLVFSVGMLGLLALQLGAKRATYEATQRSIATALARDILERMRTNPGQLPAYVRTHLGDAASPVPAPGADCTATLCSPSQLAAHDLREWEQLLVGSTERSTVGLAGGLVSPRACISHDAGHVTVAIAWLGLAASRNPAGSACGEGLPGLYDDPGEPPGNNRRRRLLVMRTYVGAGW